MRKMIPLFVFSWICLLPQVADAQIKERKIPKETEDNSSKRAKSDDYFDESGGFKHHLQYMFHTNYSIFQIFGGSFSLRLDPSVGYKINKWASAGLTTGIVYSYDRFTNPNTGAPIVLKQIDYSYGVYGRAKLFNTGIYIHTDYKLASYERPFQDQAGNVFKLKQANQQECNVGAAYRTGGAGWGTELVLLYDVMHTTDSFKQNPLDFKLGMTYNF
jgi:hypothetical protein